MTAVVAKVVCAADGSRTPHDGRYVVAWDPNTEAGVCSVTSSSDRASARVFADRAELLTEWNAVSTAQPRRPWDGKPNRPLTGLTLVMEDAS